MQNFEKTKLILLSQSKNLLNFARLQDELAFSILNNQFQTALSEAFDIFGEQMQVILPSLLADNDELQKILFEHQKNLAQERASQLKNLKQVKAYLKESR